MDENEKRRLNSIRKLSQFINSNSRNVEERQELHDYLSYLEEMSEIKKISEHPQKLKIYENPKDFHDPKIRKNFWISGNSETEGFRVTPKSSILDESGDEKNA